jgi:hypothetical protein
MKRLRITISEHIELKRHQTPHALIKQRCRVDTTSLLYGWSRFGHNTQGCCAHSEHKQEVKELRQGYDKARLWLLLSSIKITSLREAVVVYINKLQSSSFVEHVNHPGG